jgi:hypothetical protein
VLKALEMGRKPQPVVIDAVREEPPFGVREDPMGGQFVGAPGGASWWASPWVVIGSEGSGSANYRPIHKLP